METREADSTMPWIEKYRPTQFDRIVLDPLNRIFFQNILKKTHFPNLLFYGPPGTGKTTTIINLINEFQTLHYRKNKESIIHLNASDERGIDIIRTQIHQFVRSKHIFEVGPKFIILDEVDYMTKTAQQALKTLLQTCNPNVRFCLICNYISKIDDSLQEEFIRVRFNQLPKEEISQFIRTILEKEGVPFTDAWIHTIREMYQSDIRSMINFLQSVCAVNTRLDTEHPMMTEDDWASMYQKLSDRSFSTKTICQYIGELSAKYNVHKKHIIHQFLNYVLRRHSNRIRGGLFDFVEQVSHANENTPMDVLLNYFVLHMMKFLRETSNDNRCQTGQLSYA